jgi:hypothetical protein
MAEKQARKPRIRGPELTNMIGRDTLKLLGETPVMTSKEILSEMDKRGYSLTRVRYVLDGMELDSLISYRTHKRTSLRYYYLINPKTGGPIYWDEVSTYFNNLP